VRHPKPEEGVSHPSSQTDQKSPITNTRNPRRQARHKATDGYVRSQHTIPPDWPKDSFFGRCKPNVSDRPLPGRQTRPFPSKYGRTFAHTSRRTFRWDACLLALQGPRALHDRPAGTRSCRTMRLTDPGRLESSSGRCGSRPRASQVGGKRAFWTGFCTARNSPDFEEIRSRIQNEFRHLMDCVHAEKPGQPVTAPR
jgi:hypothetical protein